MAETFKALARPRPVSRPAHILPMLIAMVSMASLALNILVPAMPNMARELGIGAGVVQLTTSLYLIAFAVSQVFVGSFADQFGRRRVILIGLPLASLCSAASCVLPTIEWILIARVTEAVGAAICMVSSRAIVRDIYGREQSASAFGWITTAMVVAPMISPLIGGALDSAFGWRSIFFAIAAVNFFIFISVWLFLPETLPHDSSESSLRKTFADAAILLRDRNFLGYALTGALSSSTFFMLLGAAPFVVVETMQRSQVEYGFWFFLPSLGFMAGNMLAGRLSIKLGLHRMITAGAVIMLITGALGVFFVIVTPDAGPILMFGPSFFIAAGNGMMIPNTLAGAVSARPHAAGAAAGFTGVFHYGLAAISVQAMGLVATTASSVLILSVSIVAALIIMTLCYFALVRDHQPPL